MKREGGLIFILLVPRRFFIPPSIRYGMLTKAAKNIIISEEAVPCLNPKDSSPFGPFLLV